MLGTSPNISPTASTTTGPKSMAIRVAEGWLASALVLAVQFGERPLDRKRRPYCAFSVVLLRHRIAEQRHQPVAELLGDLATHVGDRCRRGVEIRPNQIAPFLGVELRGTG
jgi:hypothetical protein